MYQTFADYITATADRVRSVRSRYFEGAKLEQVINMSTPFELLPTIASPGKDAPYKKGILITHGFLNTPYLMRSLAHDFANAGFLVRTLLLPGHGTDYHDLDTVTWQDWLATVRFGYGTLLADCDEIYLCGFSIGATLSLLLALEILAKDTQPRLKKLILLGPCFGISPIAKIFPLLIKTHLNKFLPQLFCTHAEKEHLGSYTQFSLYSVSQIVLMLAQLKLALQPYQQQQFALPTYVVASKDDATVKFTPIINFVNNYLNRHSFFYVYSKAPLNLPPQVPHQCVAVNSINKNILEMSHVGIPVNSTDAYFGAQGAYYGHLAANINFGEPKHLQHHMKRLMYNPDYLNLQKHLINWI